MAKKKKVKESSSSNVFGMDEAKKLASSYLPKDDDKRYMTVIKDGKEVSVDKFDVMYVTEDKNVFFKQNIGEAYSHARKRNIKVFEIKWQD